MIVDRISLNIALKYLNQFQQNEGEVIDILFTYRDQVNPFTKTMKFDNMETLISFVDRYAPLVAFQDIDCQVTYLYQIQSFSIIKNGTDKNKVYYNINNFTTSSTNINQISLIGLNDGYLPDIAEATHAFVGIKINEYILNQLDYIDCGYIEIHYPEAILELETLYNKYKQI